MTVLQELARYCLSAEFVNLFTVGVAVILLNVACRYIDKFRVFDDPATDGMTKTQTHFEIWRVGPDLVIIGLLALFGVVQLAAPQLGSSRFPGLLAALLTLTVVEVTLLLFVILSLLRLNSPAKGFLRGILVPNGIGLIAVMISIGFFRFWTK